MRNYLSSAALGILMTLRNLSFARAHDPIKIGLARKNGPKRRKTGKRYPHSSTRQTERYTRQIAAGQIQFRDF